MIFLKKGIVRHQPGVIGNSFEKKDQRLLTHYNFGEIIYVNETILVIHITWFVMIHTKVF